MPPVVLISTAAESVPVAVRGRLPTWAPRHQGRCLVLRGEAEGLGGDIQEGLLHGSYEGLAPNSDGARIDINREITVPINN